MNERLALVLIALLGVSPVLAQDYSLNDAVRNAAPYDTVRVPAGTYSEETIVIDRPLWLLGEDGAVLDGEGSRGLIEITANDVTVSGLVLRNTGITFMDDRSAIRVSGATDCRIVGNRFEETFFGVYLAAASSCTVQDNHFQTTPDREVNGGNAIHSWYSRDLTIEDNTIHGHRDGIYLEFTEDSRVTGNTSTDNTRYGLHFMFSDRCSYERNLFARNGAGVAVMYAEDVVMRENRFLDAWGASTFGLLLKEIKGGEVSDSEFARNSVALFVEGTDRMTFEGNRFLDNGWAVKLLANATSNTFRDNVFVRNTFDVATNSRVASSTFVGNYWDRYRGYDLDQDGSGDVAFHPVRLFSVIVERYEPALALLRSPLVDALDTIERVFPVLTPAALIDPLPRMSPDLP